MKVVWQQLIECIKHEQQAVLISVLSTEGSTPRDAGTRMVVGRRAQIDTIGGGQLEYLLIDSARALLSDQTGLRWHVEELTLSASAGQCCGGRVKVLLECYRESDLGWLEDLVVALGSNPQVRLHSVLQDVNCLDKAFVPSGKSMSSNAGTETNYLLNPSDSKLSGQDESCISAHVNPGYITECLNGFKHQLVLFGAGHVAHALVQVLGKLPVNVLWVDSRESRFPVSLPANVTPCCDDDVLTALDDVRPGAFVLIMTHSHALDQTICEAVLDDPRVVYCGLIGSRSKSLNFNRRLSAKGIAGVAMKKLHCPIGLPGLSGKMPGEIAVSVAADLMMRWQAMESAVSDRDNQTSLATENSPPLQLNKVESSGVAIQISNKEPISHP